ncbi:MAG TPA: VWA domain-containing protein [Candidatus Angelobacter sp.]|nr:VWA domain-containing protein [Candidatus Angelobacter sp.]
MASQTIPDLQRIIVEFCRFARECGLPAGVKESLDALRAAEAVGIAEREKLKYALRAVICSSKADWDLFVEVFETFWSQTEASARLMQRKSKRAQSSAENDLQQQSGGEPLLGQGKSQITEGEGKAVLGATAHERLKKSDFFQLTDADMAELERLSMRLLQQMSLRISRRIKNIARHGRIDLRRTIRQGISRGGDLIDLSFRRRKLQQLKLVIVLDVSGSMNPYSIFFVRFAYALQKYVKRVDTFLFSTYLTEITSALRGRQLSDAMESLADHAAGWSGGTKIGDSLRELNRHHGRRLFSRDTVFMILSDGWETGDPEMMAAELGAIKRRVRKLIWLNPLLGMADYQPITRGMSAVMPYIDVFAPAHNLESLLNLEMHLKRA